MKVAILGYGTVGSGVAEVLDKNSVSISKKAGEDITVASILDLRDFPDSPHCSLFTKNYDDIINNPEIAVVIETMGGLVPAYEYVKAALSKGKSVVTSNKELVAAHGAALLDAAAKNNVNFLFEASVGGGIPIIRPLHQCLAANEITGITGILNGTTNYILTKMVKENIDFETILKTAQQLGYAERNPSADVDGHDACRKICILASLAFGSHVYPEYVYTEGITKITLDDMECASAAGCVIKLLGRAKRLDDGKVFIMVSPCVISKEHPLANVEDVFNAILVSADATGDVMFYGKGAGKLPTASAVVADIIDCAKHQSARKWLYWKDGDASLIKDHTGMVTSFLVRLDAKINLDSYDFISSQINDFNAFITKEMTEKELTIKLAPLEKNIISKIRICKQDTEL